MSDPLQSLFSRCDSVLVFDTETSGLSWQRDEIIEFSAIRLTASGTEEVDEFIRCTRSLPPRIVELTGITDDLLREEGIGKQAFAEATARTRCRSGSTLRVCPPGRARPCRSWKGGHSDAKGEMHHLPPSCETRRRSRRFGTSSRRATTTLCPLL